MSRPGAGRTELYVGLMSGTSMDGIDAALCEFSGARFVAVRALHSRPYPAVLRDELLRLSRELPALTLERYAQLDHAVGEAFAKAALAVLRRARVQPRQVRAPVLTGRPCFTILPA